MTRDAFENIHRLAAGATNQTVVEGVLGDPRGKQRVVMFCGPDRCGKTQIAKELSRVTGIPYFKASNEHTMFLSDQTAFLLGLQHADPRLCDFIKQTKTSVIFDRAFCCEWVYSQYFNRETCYRTLRYLDKEYSQLGVKVVICTRKSFAGIKDDLNPKLNTKALQQISQLYVDFVQWTTCDTQVLWVDDEDLDREVNEVLEFTGLSRAV